MKGTWRTKSAEETYGFAKQLAKQLPQGSILSLDGDLGAGKTVFTKGLCDGLGVKEMVNSPTYTLVNEYHADNGLVYHFDVYRIGDEDELYDIGFQEYLDSGAVCIVEWGAYAKDILSDQAEVIYVEINKTEDEDARIIVIR